MASVRKRRVNEPSNDSSVIWRRDKEKDTDKRRSTSDAIVIYMMLYIAVLSAVAFISHWSLPVPNADEDGPVFSSYNARRHLESITDIGIRHAGSYANDILTRDAILRAVQVIKDTAHSNVNIDTSVQQPSGHFYLNFIGGMTHLYDNLTNVAVRLSVGRPHPQDALLINCHFDSALGSPSASDDAVSCAVLLEIMRCLATGTHPLKHNVIFLFNGAEEMILPASHGFITQHKWAGQIRAFINLEAAGAGGKEIVFQTGPKHPWLSKAYARSVPHPHASVVAQEIFQSGIIPSDTDFRIFRDYGNIPGIDMAFYVNGYIYHTEHDIAQRIPDGSIQRAGDNILALIKEIANSDLLSNPGEDRHGKVSYYDVLGLYTVSYPERLGLIMNWSTLALGMAGFWFGGKRRRYQLSHSYRIIILTVPIVIVSIGFGIMCSFFTALITTVTGQTMTYFAHPLLIVPLFYIPTLLGMTWVHYWWRNKNSHLNASQMDTVTLQANQLLLMFFLLIMTLSRLASSCLPFVLLAFPLIFRTFIWDITLRPHMEYSLIKRTVGFMIFQGLSFLPVVLLIVFAVSISDMFIPLMGRAGAIVSSDYIISIISAITASLILFLIVPTMVHYCSKGFARTIFLCLGGVWLLTVLAVTSGTVFPYSGTDPVRPKRFYLQHSTVNYHSDPSLSFSGIYIHTFDYRELQVLVDYVPLLRDATEVKCEGIYCGIPSYLPVHHMMKRNWFLPGPHPPGQSAVLKVDSVIRTSTDKRNYTFTAHFPHNARLHIEPLVGLILSSWSLDSFIPPLTPYGEEGKGCYYVLYTRGIGEGDTQFWIEVQGDVTVSPALEIAVVAVYIDPPLSVTPKIREIKQSLPDWVSTIAWTSVMDVMKF